jgi:hypothetical protein
MGLGWGVRVLRESIQNFPDIACRHRKVVTIRLQRNIFGTQKTEEITVPEGTVALRCPDL